MVNQKTKDEIIFNFINQTIINYTEMKNLCRFCELAPSKVENLYKLLTDLYEEYWNRTKLT